ncbi:conserved hypothetical protein [Citreicella sp. SE45]|nr:conserved hypothetical protein [Citreicella sp. SE45]
MQTFFLGLQTKRSVPQIDDHARDTDCTEHVRPFKFASHVAEESDFLRLCLLLADGGIYADADDLLPGNPEALLQHGAGLVVFPEPTLGSIENNLLCAPRGHPVIARAVDLSLRAAQAGQRQDRPRHAHPRHRPAPDRGPRGRA